MNLWSHFSQNANQKFVKTGTGKNRGFPEHCALVLSMLFFEIFLSNCFHPVISCLQLEKVCKVFCKDILLFLLSHIFFKDWLARGVGMYIFGHWLQIVFRNVDKNVTSTRRKSLSFCDYCLMPIWQLPHDFLIKKTINRIIKVAF